MIKSFTLRFGKAPTISPETVECTPITVFVGPNNSGKSKILQELLGFCQGGQPNVNNVILDRLEFESASTDIAEGRVAAVTLRPRPNDAVHPDHVIIGKRGVRNQVPRSTLLQVLTNPASNL